MEQIEEVKAWIKSIKIDGLGWCTDGYIINRIENLSGPKRYQLMLALAKDRVLVDECKIPENLINNEDLNLIPKEAIMSQFQVVKQYYESYSGLPLYRITPEGKEACHRYDNVYTAIDDLLGHTNDLSLIEQFLIRMAGSNAGYIENIICCYTIYDGPHNHKGLDFITEPELIDQIGKEAINDLIQEGFLDKEITDSTAIFLKAVSDLFENDDRLNSSWVSNHITHLCTMPSELMEKFINEDNVVAKLGILNSELDS